MFRNVIYKTITLALILSTLFCAQELRTIERSAASALSPYSIFKLVAQEEEEGLQQLTRDATPAGQGRSAGRVDEFGREWVSECSKRLAAKMVARVNELRGQVVLEEAQSELLRVIRAWADDNDVPRYRRERLVEAIYEEFGNLSPELREKRRIQKSKFRTRLAELKRDMGRDWEDKVIYFDFNGKKVRMEVSFSARRTINLLYDAGFFFVEASGREREVGSIRLHVTYEGVIRFPLCSIETKESLWGQGFGPEMALRALMDAEREATRHGFRPKWVLARYTTGSLYALGERGKRLIEFVKRMGFERASYSTGGYSSGLHSVYSNYFQTSVMYYATVGHIQRELARRTGNAAPAEAARDIARWTREMSTHRLLNIGGEGPIDLSKTVIVMKKDLTKSFTREDTATAPMVKAEYKKMKQELRKLFNDGKNIVEVRTKTGLIRKVNELRKDPGIRVIVLGDETITKGIEEKDIKGKAGKDYCIITAGDAGNANERFMQFVNLNAMALMGVGILNNDDLLFTSSYRAFTGDSPTTEMCDEVKRGKMWLLKAFPRMVRLTNTIRDSEIISRLFAASA